MEEYYVYGHYTKDSGELFYIGVGTGHRLNHKGRNRYWKNIVAKHGYEAKKMLTGFKDRDKAVKYEIILQDFHKPRACLVYGDKKAAIVSSESRERMSVSSMGNTGNLGYKQTEETKALISKSLLGNKRSLGYKFPKTICHHCKKEGAFHNMSRYHFDNCKHSN
tara:strand:- start:1155 stop:1646 length:492 start_codon:yes stop_codon:yes gene_type:complete